MAPSLADYLAKNYLSADPAPAKKSKKRKRKGTEAANAGLVIADDDALGWEDGTSNRGEELESKGALTAGRSADFRKKKSSNWTTIGVPTPVDADQAAADAIIRTAAAENAARGNDDNDAPVIEGDVEMEDDPVPIIGGLQSAAKVKAASERKAKAEKARIASEIAAAGGTAPETIYRDASGRIINVAMKRAEARKAAAAEERKQKEEADAARGDVQMAQRDARKQELEDAKYLTVARSADDIAMNEELKEVQRWNDPAAGFLSSSKPKIASNRMEGSRGHSKPTYLGAYDPNRYNIKPGYRWDGVDRSNGFEKKWFAARNKRRDHEALEYAWQMDE